MVKDIHHSYFDAAYFVLRRDAPPSLSHTDMLTEANRLIEACQITDFLSEAGYTKKRTRLKSGILIGVTAILGLIGGAATALLCCLL